MSPKICTTNLNINFNDNQIVIRKYDLKYSETNTKLDKSIQLKTEKEEELEDSAARGRV